MSRLLPRRRVEREAAERHAAHLAGQRLAFDRERARQALADARAQRRDDAARAAAQAEQTEQPTNDREGRARR